MFKETFSSFDMKGSFCRNFFYIFTPIILGLVLPVEAILDWHLYSGGTCSV